MNPTAPIGDHDIKPTPTGKIVLDFLKGDMPAYIDTGLNVVDARDVALGQLLACERGRIGERYILGSENLTLAEILAKLAAIAGRPAPNVKLPYAVAYAAGVVTTAWARLPASRRARRSMRSAWRARRCSFRTPKPRANWVSRPGPAEGALRRAVEWFRANGYC